MLTPSSLLKRLSALTLLLVCQAQAYAQTAQPTTPEIDFTSPYAQQTLALQATQLANQGNAVAIYQYAYNNFVFEPYHGSHSGSVNTFLGLHGNDVDIASSLIAMLRSQYIPARYAVGTVQLSAAQLTNWLGTGSANVAFQLLIDQGFQKLSYATTVGGSYTAVTETGTAPNIEYVVPAAAVTSVQFEHAWVEALIPYDQYRGLPTPTAVDCTQPANASRCVWVPLDASYKQFTYNNYGLNPTTGTSPVSFNYTNYYDAIKNNDPTQLNLNPLSILENQITSWLQTNYAGHTLDDVANVGQIIPINDGLLPASLPYSATNVRHYDSVALHDAAAPPTCTSSCAEVKPWAKYLTVTFNSTAYDIYANAYPYTITSTPILEASLNTDRLTLYTAVNSSITNVPLLNLNLGGSSIFSTSSAVFTIGGNNITVSASSPANVGNYSSTGQTFSVTLNLTGAPDATGGSNDQTITATYNNLNTSGYFAAVTGGAYSNWAQVHNAANQLLANQLGPNYGGYTIVFNPSDPGTSNGACDFTTGLNCTPYVDVYGTGVYNANDPTLLNDPAALDALTGGLLYVAGMQYYANFVDDINQVNRLMQTRTSIAGFVGLVSSVYEAEYINNTAFSVMPGGLLIDMRGTQFGGIWSNTASPVSNASFSNSVFYLMGHIGSSLEHETWQELTGYDAVSTVRGIQMALSNTATSLLNITSLSGLQSEYTNFGFSTSLPTGFTAKTFKVCSSSPYTWNTACSGSSDTFNVWTSTSNPSAFDTFLSSVSTSTSALQQEVQTYTYDTTSQYAQDYRYYWANCTNNLVNSIAALPASTTFPTSAIVNNCDNTPINPATTPISQAQALANVYADWSGSIVPFLNSVITDQFNYFDENQGFSTTGRLYRSYPPAAGQYSAPTIGSIRTDFGIPPSGSTLSYAMPSTAVATPYNNFEVYIRTQTGTASGTYSDLTFKINNLGL
jgi:hypothetical protein